MTHTPGPWMVGDVTLYNPGFLREIRDETGRLVALAERPTGFNGITVEMRDANARLIAAAPDLLAACHAAHSFFASYSTGDNEATEKFRIIGAAIAKAEGEQS